MSTSLQYSLTSSSSSFNVCQGFHHGQRSYALSPLEALKPTGPLGPNLSSKPSHAASTSRTLTSVLGLLLLFLDIVGCGTGAPYALGMDLPSLPLSLPPGRHAEMPRRRPPFLRRHINRSAERQDQETQRLWQRIRLHWLESIRRLEETLHSRR